MSVSATRPRGPASSPAWVLALCFLIVVFDGYDLIVFGAAVPALLDHPQWDLTPDQVGVIGSLALAGMLIGAMLSGALADLIGRRRLVLFCLVWFSVAMLAVAAAPTPEALGLFRFLAGLGFGGVTPTGIALVVEWAPPHRRNLNTAIVSAGFPIGGVLAGAAGATLLSEHGFRVLFALGGLALVTVVPLAIWKLPESPQFEARRAGVVDRRVPVKDILRGRLLAVTVIFGLANFASFLVLYGLVTWMPKLMLDAGYEMGPSQAFLLLLNLGAVLGGTWASSIADRVGGHVVVPIAFVLGAVCVLMLGVEMALAPLYILVFLAGAFALGVQPPLFGYAATSFETEHRASALGVVLGVARLGGITGPILGGFLVARDLGLLPSFAVFAAIALAGGLFVTLLRRGSDARKPDTAAEEQPV
jgi:MFS transporter, AAHS family, benzoate transport protein